MDFALRFRETGSLFDNPVMVRRRVYESKRFGQYIKYKGHKVQVGTSEQPIIPKIVILPLPEGITFKDL